MALLIKKTVENLITRLKTAVLAAALCAGASAVAEPVEQFNSNAFWFENWGDLKNATMTVTAPDGAQTRIDAAGGTPVYRLPGDGAMDGVYQYELSAATTETSKIVNPIDNGRGDAAKDEIQVGLNKNGRFVVLRGVIIEPEDITEDAQ